MTALHDNESQAPRFYEPWQRKVGDRVRYRCNYECRYAQAQFDGDDGRVVGISTELPDGHHYGVEMVFSGFEFFAAAELELVEASS